MFSISCRIQTNSIVGTRLVTYFFLTLMLLKVCIMPLIYLDFELRRDYIVKNLCINRDRPELNCDGKCYLAKRIAAAREKEEQKAERNFIYQLCETLAEPIKPAFPVFSETLPHKLAGKKLFHYSPALNDRLLISGVFHPPVEA